MLNTQVGNIMISPDIEKIFPKVESALAEFFLRVYGEHLQSIEKMQEIERLYSTVVFLRIQLNQDVHRLVMKTTTHHPINKVFFEKENQAEVEFGVLKSLYPRFENVKNCNVPEPILVLPEIETYVMRFVEGTLMMDTFCYTRKFSSCNSFKLLRTNMYLYGKWLKHFQDFTSERSSNGSLAYEQVIERAMHRVKLIVSEYGNVVPQNFSFDVEKFFTEQLSLVSNCEVQLYGRHGDFTPLNAIVSAEGVTVIDFLGFDYEPPEVDVLKVLIFLENESMAFSSSKSRVRDLKAAFMDGYGSLSGVLEPGLIISEAMQRMVSIWGHLSTPKRLFHHRLESSRIIKRHLTWFVDHS